MKASAPSTKVSERISGRCDNQRVFVPFCGRSQADRRGALTMSRPPAASMRCVGLSSVASSTSKPKRVCQKKSLIPPIPKITIDRKSTRLNSSHSQISYAVFCLKKKKTNKKDNKIKPKKKKKTLITQNKDKN